MTSNTNSNRGQESMKRFDGDVRFMEALKERPDAFNEALSNLNDISDADAQWMLGCAVMNNDPDSGAVFTCMVLLYQMDVLSKV